MDIYAYTASLGVWSIFEWLLSQNSSNNAKYHTMQDSENDNPQSGGFEDPTSPNALSDGEDLPPFQDESEADALLGNNQIEPEDEGGDGEELFGDAMERWAENFYFLINCLYLVFRKMLIWKSILFDPITKLICLQDQM